MAYFIYNEVLYIHACTKSCPDQKYTYTAQTNLQLICKYNVIECSPLSMWVWDICLWQCEY